MGTDIWAAVHGAALSYNIWLPVGAVVVELIPCKGIDMMSALLQFHAAYAAGHKFRALFFPECFTCSIRLDIKGVRKVLSDALSDWASPRTASLDSSNWTAESLRTLSFYDIENLAFR